MKKFLFVIFSFSLFFLLISCTPYDSNKVNLELLQGNWLLVETGDGLTEIEQGRDTTFITIKDNSLFEYIPDLNHQDDFSFTVSNYNLNLYIKDQHIDKLEIIKLTQDSLILKTENDIRKYIKFD